MYPLGNIQLIILIANVYFVTVTLSNVLLAMCHITLADFMSIYLPSDSGPALYLKISIAPVKSTDQFLLFIPAEDLDSCICCSYCSTDTPYPNLNVFSLSSAISSFT